ncbi:TPR end-of-group domain-containing protein [Chitinophaga sp. NPDC101104]|uniref:TPR end-of-group domain-containing protein n=1 Tax=Chitinophaga sp. NPDC101104 TaxID=3390561 RepID=UPI003D004A68
MRYIPLIAMFFAATACNEGGGKSTYNAGAYTLTEQYHLDADSVFRFAARKDLPEAEADRLFRQAIDKYRNKKDPAGALPLFRQSILKAPRAAAFFEYGNALSDLGNGDKSLQSDMSTKQALQAYHIADLLGYKPLSKLLYNTACIYAKMEQEDSAFHYLVSAIEFGYTNTDQIYKDQDLAKLRAHRWRFDNEITTALSGASDPDRLLWKLFSREFQPLELPVVFDLKYGEDKTFDDVTYDFEKFIPEMRDGKFSRDVGSEFYYIGSVQSTPLYTVVTYAVKDVMMDEAAPLCYYLASFDPNGKLLDKLIVGGHRILDEPFRVGKITANGDVEVKKFAVRYEKDPATSGYAENKMEEMNEVGVEYFAISADGHITPKSAPLAMK